MHLRQLLGLGVGIAGLCQQPFAERVDFGLFRQTVRAEQVMRECQRRAYVGVSGSIGTVNLTGDGLALIMTIAMAAIMVIYRMFPTTPSGGPSVMQSLFLIPPSFIFGAPFQTEPLEIVILAAFGLLFAIASVTLAEGAKRVPSGQTALLSALETPLAPLLAFFIFAEMPSTVTLLGGGIVLIAVLLSIKDESTSESAVQPEGPRQ